jgi:ATP-dependent DNA helicase RecQ
LQQGEEYPLLVLNEASWEVMRGQRAVRLVQPVRRKKGEKAEKAKVDTVSWEGIDKDLFEALRGLRRRLAEEKQMPPYVIFPDTVLRSLARIRPSSLERMRLVSGIGDAKLRQFGEAFLEIITIHCRERLLSRDNPAGPAAPVEAPKAPSRPNPVRDQAFTLFRQRAAIEDVMHQTNRSRSTVMDYLSDYIREERPASIATWVANEVYQRVAAAGRQVGTERLKPIFIALGEKVSYDDIRLVLAHLSLNSNRT